MQRIENILFPIDFSECSHKACPYAIEVATKFNAQIHLLFVAQDLSYLSAEDTASQKWLDMTNQIALSGEEQMEAFCKRHMANFPHFQTKVVIGNPKEKILRYAMECSVDMIIMGTHGRTGTDRILMGSVADWVVKHAAIPVLTLNPFRSKM